VSEIQALTDEIARRSGQVDFWNTAIIIVGIVTFIAAGALVISQFVAFRRAKQLTDAQAQLLTVKDAELQRDLGSKDVRIQEAGERAAKADAAAAIARADAAHAAERAASLEKEAADAKLETERIKQVVAWRELSPATASRLAQVLASKPGAVNLRYTDGDPEALAFASQFARVLEAAKWRVAPGAAKLANAIQFGITLPDSNGIDANTLRLAFSAAKIEYSTEPLQPVGMIGFAMETINGAPTLWIGSKRPPTLK